MLEQYNHFAEIEGEVSDVPTEHHGPDASASSYPYDRHDGAQAMPKMPSNMPWCAMVDVVPPAVRQRDDLDMDAMPLPPELHSKTKDHQLGGIYESYSSLKP